MLTYLEARSRLEQMERACSETARHLGSIICKIERNAESGTIFLRAKKRQYGRHASTWTPADEKEYQTRLDTLYANHQSEIQPLSRKLQRQVEAIKAFRQRHGFNITSLDIDRYPSLYLSLR